MTELFGRMLLLAETPLVEYRSEALRRVNNKAEFAELMRLAPYATALALAAIAFYAWNWFKKRNDFTIPCNDPQRLFRQLCAAHNLNLSSRRLLIELAAAWEMAQPAAVFVTPSAFRVNDLPEHLRKEEARINELAAKLF